MKFISGLFAGKKENGNFFLELKDEPDEPMPKADSKPVEASTNGKKPAAAATTQKDTTKVKKADGKVKEVPSEQVVKVDVEMVQTAKGLEAKAVPVEKKEAQKKAAKEAVTTDKPEDNKETLFAPKYLIPKNNNVRRRPGANMSSFLDMASQVKTPVNK
ncbi:hypothetical protein NIES267_51480 [Calothrix parasitica NIES-267]|uniref:Uncharacterized protein n=1 Tax=Calothrix parasitica NIES-267 TaxID=1973488 RepID=A0A1Z4LWL0_9CYAN|nr:hypothetical protein NIES267_51480 [Calothrix parasitica NIES-267]